MGWSDITDDEGNVCGVVGDAGWDLADNFVESFHILYLKSFGRVASLREITDSIEFVYATVTEEVNK